MGFVLSIQNQKGGVGKSTLACNLAHAASRDGLSVLLVDSDPQCSTRRWATLRGEAQLPFQVVGNETDRLHIEVQGLAQRYDLIVIDGQGREAPVTRSGIAAGTVILLPCGLSAFDVTAMLDTLHLVEEMARYAPIRRYPIVVSQQRIPYTREAQEIERQLRERFDVLESRTMQRVAYLEAASRGMTVFEDPSWSKSADEISAIWAEVKAHG